MRRRHDDFRFEIVAPAKRRGASTRRALDGEVPALVPVRVVPSTAPLAQQADLGDAGSVEVVLPDDTRLRFSSGVSAAFLVEVVASLRSTTC